MIRYKKILDNYKRVYNIRYRIFHDVVVINTDMGDWAIIPRLTKKGFKFELKHKNIAGNSGKFHYHRHNFYDKFIHALKYIVTHDIKRFYPNYEVPKLGA